jgi:hypothetical protein
MIFWLVLKLEIMIFLGIYFFQGEIFDYFALRYFLM